MSTTSNVDYYAVLGVDRGASDDEIRKTYRRLARQYHPDLNKEVGAEERFKQIGEAFDVLGDSDKRAAYDKYGHMWKHAEEIEAAAQRQAAYPHQGRPRDLNFRDLFEELFGAAADAEYSTGAGRTVAFQMPGADQHATMRISLEEAFQGTTRSIRLTSTEMQPDGRLVQKPRELKVKVPAGVTNGQTLRLEGQGGRGTGGAPDGNLYLEIEIEPHRMFEVNGKDIYLSLPITPWEAALGARIMVPVLGGSVEMTIPAGAQSGGKLRLKGKGLPGNSPGDQYVVLKIVTPRPQTDKQRDIYQKMANEFAFDARAGLGA